MKSIVVQSKELTSPANNPKGRLDASFHILSEMLKRPGGDDAADKEAWEIFTGSVARMTTGEVIMALRKAGETVDARVEAVRKMLGATTPDEDLSGGIRRLAVSSIREEIGHLEAGEKRLQALRASMGPAVTPKAPKTAGRTR